MTAASKVTALPIVGRTRPKRRARLAREIGPEQIELFFETLSDSCNVALSAKAAGFSATWAYNRKREDAGFRGRWARAVREAYAKLELILLERAISGTEKAVRSRGGEDAIIREYSTPLAIALLKRHAETVDGTDGIDLAESDSAELREKIIAQLDLLRERAEAAGKAGTEVETKNAGGRLALIERMLKR